MLEGARWSATVRGVFMGYSKCKHGVPRGIVVRVLDWEQEIGELTVRILVAALLENSGSGKFTSPSRTMLL